MLHALLDREVKPDLIVGTSVGALHGAPVAADPTTASVERLERPGRSSRRLGVLGRSWLTDAASLIRSRTHVRSDAPLRRLAERLLGVATFDELAVPFQCVAARSSDRASTGSARGRWSTPSSPYWRVPAAEVPHERDALIAWLYGWWQTIDD